MNIALDYDETYTADPDMWDDFIDLSLSRGHGVFIVTARCKEKDPIREARVGGLLEDIPIIYCDGVAKKWCLHHHHGIDINIWIDDRPDNILNNSVATKEQLAEWRKVRV